MEIFGINKEIVYIACPNNCHSGMVKHFPDKDNALYVMIKCQFCKGEGKIKESDKDKINTLIDNYDIYHDVVIFPNL
jgi:hypothetical protein